MTFHYECGVNLAHRMYTSLVPYVNAGAGVYNISISIDLLCLHAIVVHAVSR